MTNIRYSYTFLNKFSIQGKIPGVSDVILRSRDTNKLVLMKEMQVSYQEYEQTIATLEYQKRLEHEQLLSLVDYHGQQEQNRVMVLYEYCRISLQEEFENRLSQQRYFEENELWSIFTSLAFGLAYLQQENVGHGSLSLLDSYLNEQGFIKIVDPTCASSNPYRIVEGYYYSPQILRCLIYESDEQMDIFKNDVFVLGCCMLKLTLMRDVGFLFDYQNGLVDRNGLREVIHEIQGFGLSREYLELLKWVLVLDYHQRPDFVGLKARIFDVLSIDSCGESQELNSRCFDIKSSISSMQKSRGQEELNIYWPTIINQKKPVIKQRYRRSQDYEIMDQDRKVLREVSCGFLNNVKDNNGTRIKLDFMKKQVGDENECNLYGNDFYNPQKSLLGDCGNGKDLKLQLFKEKKCEIQVELQKMGFGEVDGNRRESLGKAEMDLRLSFETSCSKVSKNSNKTNYTYNIIPPVSKIETLKAELDKIMINKPSPTMTPKGMKKEQIIRKNEDYSDPGFLKMMQEEMSCILNRRKIQL